MTGWILIQNLSGLVKIKVLLLHHYLEKPGTSILASL